MRDGNNGQHAHSFCHQQRQFLSSLSKTPGFGSESEHNGAVTSLEFAEASEPALFVSCFLDVRTKILQRRLVL